MRRKEPVRIPYGLDAALVRFAETMRDAVAALQDEAKLERVAFVLDAAAAGLSARALYVAPSPVELLSAQYVPSTDEQADVNDHYVVKLSRYFADTSSELARLTNATEDYTALRARSFTLVGNGRQLAAGDRLIIETETVGTPPDLPAGLFQLVLREVD